MEHRGRFQAQGKSLEESESWSQKDPLSLYVDEAKTKLILLEEKLSSAERKKRQKAFNQCRIFMLRACENGGILVVDKALRKSFPGNNIDRVDVEVLKGQAFLVKEDGTC